MSEQPAGKMDAHWFAFEDSVTELLRGGFPEDELERRIRELAEYERDTEKEDLDLT